ncbi:MAG TPA: hypothetical protein VLB47_10535 [Solirubrobacteraceae bacterium]|nr:hypothetical protein [Solirubrobacteraceae bacterium]
MLAAVVAAAEAAETSKTAFYVAGGVLAALAVLLALFGISRASFPGSRAAERGVMAVTVVLVLAAMITSVATA